MPIAAAQRFIGAPRPMTREDMAATLAPAFKVTVTAAQLRDSHHRVARLFAAGLRVQEIIARTGYSNQRLVQLRGSPAFQELVERYRAKVDAAFERSQDEYHTLATSNMLRAERMLADRLEKVDAEEMRMTTKDLLAITRDGADRFGYGKTLVNVNVNADFAAELEKAIARSGKVVELRPATPALRRRA